MSETKKPTHRAYVTSENGDKTHWTEIGAMWRHSDGDGFTMLLDLVPTDGRKIVIRKAKPHGENAS